MARCDDKSEGQLPCGSEQVSQMSFISRMTPRPLPIVVIILLLYDDDNSVEVRFFL